MNYFTVNHYDYYPYMIIGILLIKFYHNLYYDY